MVGFCLLAVLHIEDMLGMVLVIIFYGGASAFVKM